jgi:hypothetical protein
MACAHRPLDDLVERCQAGDVRDRVRVGADQRNKSQGALPAITLGGTMRFVGCATFFGHITQVTNAGGESTTTSAATTKIMPGSNNFGSYRG